MNQEWSGNRSKLGRRDFLGLTIGLSASASLGLWAEGEMIQATSDVKAKPQGLASTGDFEQRLSKIDRLDLLGFPCNWAVVRDEFHPFAPERIGIWPSGRLNFDRCGHSLRRRLDRKIDGLWADCTSQGHPIPTEKRETIYRIIDRWIGHYDRPDLFQPWVLGLAGREILDSTSIGEHCGLAHQYHGVGKVRVDCPPVDWWLFLFPDGIDWASPSGQPIHVILGHVGRTPWFPVIGFMNQVWGLTHRLITFVEDWPEVSRMGRKDATKHLNRAIVSILEEDRH